MPKGVKTFARATAQHLTFKGWLSIAPLAIAVALPGVAVAQSGNTKTFDIPAQSLNDALTDFGQQSGLQVSVDASEIRGVSSPGASGAMSAPQALSRLLAGTGFAFRISGNIVTLEKAPRSADGAVQLGPVRVEGNTASNGGQSVSSDPGATERTGSYAFSGASTTATRLAMAWRDTPQSISVISRPRIEDQQLNSVSDVLNQAPGVTLSFTGSERFQIMSRGFALSDYQMDGVNTNSNGGNQNVPQGLVDMAIYDRIEVLRGAAGLLTGAGQPAGAVNLIRKRPTVNRQAYVQANLGSWERYRVEGDLSGAFTSDGRVRGRIVGVYQNSHSFRDAERLEKIVAYGTVEADLTDTTLIGAGIDYQRYSPRGAHTNGVPLFWSDGSQSDLDRDFNRSSRDAFDRKSTYNINLRLEQKLGDDWLLKISGNHLRNNRDFNSGGAYFATGFPDRSSQAILVGGSYSRGDGHQRQYGVDATLQGSFRLLGRTHEIAIGANYTDFANLHSADTAFTAPRATTISAWDHQLSLDADYLFWGTLSNKVTQYGGYATARLKPTDSLSIILGGRVTHYKSDTVNDLRQRYNIYIASSERTRGKFTPYAGVVYAFDDRFALYASYTDIFSPQGQQDRDGNILSPVVGSNIEAGLKAVLMDGRLNASLAFYSIKQDNVAILDPGFSVPGSPDTPAYQAVSGAKSKGIELELIGEILPGWNISASFSHGDRKNRDGSRLNTIAPVDIGKLWTTWTIPATGDRLTIGGGVNWQSGIYLIAAPAQIGRSVRAEQGAYAVAALMARYRVTDKLSVAVNADNLFNTRYTSLEGQFFSGYYGTPRSGQVTVRYDF